MRPIPPDIEIAQSAEIWPIEHIASKAGILPSELHLYGRYKAKVDLSILRRLEYMPDGKLIVVTGINPTPLGEGKTVTAIGLGQGLFQLGKSVFNTIREPSKGPTFGIKGGGCGGGYSQVIPMEEINLHFTGDIYAVEAAHNLANAILDNSLLKGNPCRIDPFNIVLRRCIDINDRVLRQIIVALGGRQNGIIRQTGFDITAASETMAILALAKDTKDLRERLGRMVVAYNEDGSPITAEDIKAAGPMAALLTEAIKPNLVQTLEHSPVFVHCGPFANVAHGNSSIVADKIALKLADYVITEAGFGTDCGFEKMVNIKARYGNFNVDCAVLVVSLRAIKMHGGAFKIGSGYKIDPELVKKENTKAVELGAENMIKHIENILKFNVPVVVAINHFIEDCEKEIELLKKIAKDAGAEDAVLSDAWREGGKGCIELAKAVIKAANKESKMRFLYPLDLSIKDKIEIIATQIYGADGVDYDILAEKKIKRFTELGYSKLPICIAKTPLSLSDNPALLGRPRNFRIHIRDVRESIGAGFIYPLCGDIMTMPGLPTEGAYKRVDIDESGRIYGLF